MKMKQDKQPWVLSERRGRWLLNLYPPFIFNRIHIVSIGPGFRSCQVRISRSPLTRNLNGTIFGGSIFAAADPFYAVMLWQIFGRKGLRVQTWLRSASIRYLKPASSRLTLEFALSDEQIQTAAEELDRTGRFVCSYDVEARNVKGELCAAIQTEAYIRLPRAEQKARSVF
jgi:acyl-coenzyme A thioesterase PaaI-like protein